MKRPMQLPYTYDEGQALIVSPTLRIVRAEDAEYFSQTKDLVEKIQHAFPLLDSLKVLVAFVKIPQLAAKTHEG